MENEILDSPSEEPQGFQYAYLIPYVILWAGMLLSGLFGLLTNFTYLIGLVGLILTGVVYVFNKKVGVMANAFVLFLGIINIAEFFPIGFTFGFKINETFTIGINILILAIAAFFLHFNMEDFQPQFQKIFHGTTEPNNEIHKSRISHFKRLFQNKTQNELCQIADNPSMQDAARAAAKALLQERDGSIKNDKTSS